MADAYEREQMPGVGEVLYRHKVTSPKWALWLVLLLPAVPLAGVGIATALAGQLLGGLAWIAGGLASAAGMAFLHVTFGTARIAVSEGELHVQLGMAGPKLPIGEIASVAMAPSGTNKVGMGVGNDLRGTTTFRMWGDNARAVHVTKTDGKKLVLVTKEPEALFAALEEALARRGRSSPKVRVGDVEADEAGDTGEKRARARR